MAILPYRRARRKAEQVHSVENPTMCARYEADHARMGTGQWKPSRCRCSGAPERECASLLEHRQDYEVVCQVKRTLGEAPSMPGLIYVV